MNSAEPPNDVTPSLVAALRTGDPDAARLLESLYHGPLLRFCRGYLQRDDAARDAVQDVFCKVIASSTVAESFRPWIYGVARNLCLNVLRSQERRPEKAALGSDAGDLAASLTGQLTGIARAEERARLNAALLSLSLAHREVLRLRYTEQLPRDEIAAILDVPVGRVKSRLFEALKILRAHPALRPPSSA